MIGTQLCKFARMGNLQYVTQLRGANAGDETRALSTPNP